MQVNTKDFLKELTWAARFAEKKTTIPILAHIALVARPDSLSIAGTDLELFGSTSVAASGEPGWTVCVPASGIRMYLSKVREGHIDLSTRVETGKRQVKRTPAEGGPEVEVEEEFVRSISLLVRHGGCSACFKGMAADNFPAIETVPKPELLIDDLKTLVPKITTSISKEESRFTLNGALLDATGSTPKLISTDGHRLSVCDISLHANGQTFRTIISKAALLEAASMNGGSAYFGFNEDSQIFLSGRRSLISRKLTGNFPDYERVLPRSLTDAALFPAEETIDVLERLLLFADKRQPVVRIAFSDGKATLSSRENDTGEASGSVALGGGSLAGICAGYNIIYLLDMLRQADGQVCFQMSTQKPEQSAAVLSDGKGWQYVLMPMRF